MRHLQLVYSRPRASVYVLERLDRSKFKIGWALDPLKRVRQLPEFDAQLVDLRRSRVLWLPSRHRAEQVERSMQKSLGPYRSPADHQGDGHSEWFDGVAHHIAWLNTWLDDEDAGEPPPVPDLRTLKRR